MTNYFLDVVGNSACMALLGGTMSVVKRFEIKCDICLDRLEWSKECIANSRGRTNGGGTREVAAEAKAAGWQRRTLSHGVKVDLCPECKQIQEIDHPVWFEVSA